MPDLEDEIVNTDDTRRIANALFTQRPLTSDEAAWNQYRMICASLVRLLANELVRDNEFDAAEFLVHCGFAPDDADEIARRPGAFIRRSEDAVQDQNQ
jgi:hypothetical protein